MISFDKVGKSVNEEHYLIRDPINETLDLIRIINKVRHLGIDYQKILCRWLSLGIIERSKVSLDPLGSVTFMDWSSEYDSLIHGLVDLGIARIDGRGYVVVPFMMQWFNVLGDALSSACAMDSTSYEGEDIDPSPMYMRLPVSKEVLELDNDDLTTLLNHRIKSLGNYISGKIVYIGANVRSLGFMNQVVFKTPVDLLIMTRDNSIIAHRILDPTRTVHRGYSAVEDYLMNGVDYAIIIHRYTNSEFHVEVVNDIINKPRINNAGYAVVIDDANYLVFYKWPQINKLIGTSRTVGMSRSLLISSLKFLINGQ